MFPKHFILYVSLFDLHVDISHSVNFKSNFNILSYSKWFSDLGNPFVDDEFWGCLLGPTFEGPAPFPSFEKTMIDPR
jgi:hypothetical protein